MGKSIFPLNPDYEDEKFDDPDKKFNTLPYHNEIPEIYTEPYRTPPFSFQFMGYQTCRQKVANLSFYSFIFGWVVLGRIFMSAKYGNAVTRWRALWCNLASGIASTCMTMIGLKIFDPSCSPHSVGRRRNLFYDESLKHALDSKYGLYDNLHLIMHSKERITRQQFFETIVKVTENYKNEHSE